MQTGYVSMPRLMENLKSSDIFHQYNHWKLTNIHVTYSITLKNELTVIILCYTL